MTPWPCSVSVSYEVRQDMYKILNKTDESHPGQERAEEVIDIDPSICLWCTRQQKSPAVKYDNSHISHLTGNEVEQLPQGRQQALLQLAVPEVLSDQLREGMQGLESRGRTALQLQPHTTISV